MATEQYITQSDAHNQILEDGTPNGFDCNICLEIVRDPVVTTCGHLYCWPCIYKWIDLHQQPQCPVCKSDISEASLIPLYGRSQPLTAPAPKAGNLGLSIPDRPRGPPPSRGAQEREAGSYDYTSAQEMGLARSSVINMFGEMIYTRLFGNPQSFYSYPVSYGMASVWSARARRQTLKTDQSLTRLCFFLCCCLLLCLVLF